MARATLTTVQRMVYENLGISNGYGTLLTNARYPTGYIDDRIAEADIATVQLLMKHKQSALLPNPSTVNITTTSTTIPQNWEILNVNINGSWGIEIPIGLFEIIGSGIFNLTYDKYYSKWNGVLYVSAVGGTIGSGYITYLDLTHATSLSTLFSPSGFEAAVANLASSLLLMKRGDKPEQAKFYKGLYDDFMQKFFIPDTNRQDIISD